VHIVLNITKIVILLIPKAERICDTRMKSRPGVLFSAKELQRLVTVSASRVHVERRIRHIAVLPNCLRDLKSAVQGILNSYQNKFDIK
jgi:hypothetical protein